MAKKPTEAEIVAAAPIEVMVDGQTRRLPILKFGKTIEWKKALAKAMESESGEIDPAKPSQAVHNAVLSAERTLDLVLSYDLTKVLGGRDWLLENATEEDVDSVFQAILNRVFFKRATALVESQSASEPSPNGHSPSGVLTPIR